MKVKRINRMEQSIVESKEDGGGSWESVRGGCKSVSEKLGLGESKLLGE